jgi:dTDP-glucose 4,6-dehydratase
VPEEFQNINEGEQPLMNLLVTGGCGFIGSNFIRQRLMDKSDNGVIVNLDQLTYAGNPENLEDLAGNPRYIFQQGDIGDQDIVSKILGQHNISAILNFAAESHVDRSIDSPEPFLQTNVIGTLRLLDAAKDHFNTLSNDARQSFRFLHVSTDEVYGTLEADDPAFSETTPFAPNSPYAASKASSDHLVRAYHHTYGLPVLTTNCSNNYGPYQFPEKLIPLMILNAIEGKDLPIYGDGMNVRDWLYVEDHCTAIWTVLQQGKTGETYNVGGLCEKPNIEIVDTLCEALDQFQPRKDGGSYKTQKIFVKDRPGHDRRYAIDCEKLTSELGWEPQESFESGLHKTVQWYLTNRQWCSNIADESYQRERLGLRR